MKAVSVVIGANYGDECKGLVTDVLTREYLAGSDRRISCVNILCNGSAQRGHTVDYPNGTRHIYHHFGSGTLSGARTYYTDRFLLHPTIFVGELAELTQLSGGPISQPLCSPYCQIITPFDALINQLEEERRGVNRHGSCGAGVFAAIRRQREGDWKTIGWYQEYFNFQTESAIKDIEQELRRIITYTIQYITTHDLSSIYNKHYTYYDMETILRRFMGELAFMCSHIKCVSPELVWDSFDYAVFENGQGLGLDQKLIYRTVHLTPSHTDSTNPSQWIWCLPEKRGMQAAVTVHYITRAYCTRHGAGELLHEMDKELVDLGVPDYTNIPNPWQQTLRYAPIKEDSALWANIQRDTEITYPVEPVRYLWVTHMNETRDPNWFVQQSNAHSLPIDHFNFVYNKIGDYTTNNASSY